MCIRDSLYGLYQQEAGDIYINGSKEEISSPIKAISLGIGMVHQHFMLARPMTVVENVMPVSYTHLSTVSIAPAIAAAINEVSEGRLTSLPFDIETILNGLKK